MTYKEWKRKNPDIMKKRKEEMRMKKIEKRLEEVPHYEPPYWPVVIAGFPGVGKTYAAEHSEEWGMKIVEVETSPFLWVNEEDGLLRRNREYPENYYKEVLSYLTNGQSVDVILVDAHSIIQQVLLKHNVRFVTVYPRDICREEYLRRYIRSGKPFPFVDTINENWDSLINDGKERAKKGQNISFLGSDSYLDEDFILNVRCNYGALRAAAMVGRQQL